MREKNSCLVIDSPFKYKIKVQRQYWNLMTHPRLLVNLQYLREYNQFNDLELQETKLVLVNKKK